MTGSTLSTQLEYQIFSSTFSRQREAFVSREQNAREIQYFAENIGNVESVEDFLDDSRLYRFALTAFGLESQIFARALIERTLEEGASDPEARARRSTDERFLELTVGLGFIEAGEPRQADARRDIEIIDRYIDQQLETELGERNPGAQLAAYFARQVQDGEVNSYFDIFSDRALLEVSRVSFGLPQEAVQGDLDSLARRLEDRLPIEDLLNNPEELDRFIRRFTIRYDIENGNLGGSSGQARLGLFQPAGNGLSSSILETLASLPNNSFVRRL